MFEQIWADFDTLKNQENEDNNKCSNCGTAINDDVCTECGLVNENQIIDTSAEYHCYDNDTINKTRCQKTNDIFKFSTLNTHIMNGKKQEQFLKYQYWNKIPYKERKLMNIFRKIDTICENNDLTEIINIHVKELYKKCNDKGTKKGILPACFYFTCISLNCPRLKEEIAKMFQISLQKMTEVIGIFSNHMPEYVNDLKKENPEDYVSRYSQLLTIPRNIVNQIYKILNDIKDFECFNNYNTKTITISVIVYILQKNNINVKKIYNICEINKGTVTNCLKKISPILNLL